MRSPNKGSNLFLKDNLVFTEMHLEIGFLKCCQGTVVLQILCFSALARESTALEDNSPFSYQRAKPLVLFLLTANSWRILPSKS